MAMNEIMNGQVWEQQRFPHNMIVVLMLGRDNRVDGELLFCKAAICDSDRIPFVATDVRGRWTFTALELEDHLDKFGYLLIGTASVSIKKLVTA